MGSENSKSGSKPGANGPAESPHDHDGTSKSTGRVKFDDRGNAIWEWQVATGAFSPEVSTQRLQRLEHPALSIADDAPTPVEQVRANPLGTKKGYDPYDSGKLGKAPAPPRKKDLRKLSEWLKLKKQADENKDDDSKE
ncbi:MAG: hypothetical protein QOF42_3595 [Gammaproteobacteria bacterium]|jgi:hypothetical protein|nr:hypothetical protein [Gammaproteobacteria bacterium]